MKLGTLLQLFKKYFPNQVHLESILIFGGGENQRTLIQSAKQLGFRTIVIDPNPEAAARTEADIFKVIDTKDKAGTIALTKKYNIKGIVTCQMENPLFLMAEIAEEMGYIFPTKESIIKARNKWLMKQCFLENTVPCSEGVLIKAGIDIRLKDLKGLLFPFVIKPLDSFSSRGVYKVNNIEEIQLYINNSRQFSSNGDIIIEEFLDGPEVSVESVTQNGITEVIQITDKAITPYPTTVEMAHVQPSNHKPEIQVALKTIVRKAIRSLGLDNCATHSEVKITDSGVKVVEVGARLGGDYITSHLVPLSAGVNIEAAAINISMGKIPDIERKETKGSAIRYLNLPSGKKVMRIGNWKEILNKPYIKHALIMVKKDEIISPITDSAKRKGFVIVQGKDRKDAQDLSDMAISSLAEYILLRD